MIVTSKKSWLQLLFALQGSTILEIWPRILVVILFSTAATIFSKAGYLQASLTPVPFTIVGLALAIFLGFRNNAAYDRYWEGRKLWGALVNVTRNFAIQTRVLKPGTDELAARKELVHSIVAFVNCLRHRLRDSRPDNELFAYVQRETADEILRHRNVPLAVLDHTTRMLVDQWRAGNLETYHLTALQADIARMLDVQGGCERIKTTPIPFTYSVLTHRTVTLYCLALPFGLHDIVGWAMPIVAGFVSYAFFALDDLGDEIEQPFGLQPNSLPLHSICRNIEINLLQLIDTPDQELPVPIVPQNDILT